MAELRSLVIVLGDQLDLDAAAFDGFDAGLDAVWMAEVAEESTHVWSSKPRTVMFLAAMRHFAIELQACGRPQHYSRLDADGNDGSLGARLQDDILRLRPARLVMTASAPLRVAPAVWWPNMGEERATRRILVDLPGCAGCRVDLRFRRESEARAGMSM